MTESEKKLKAEFKSWCARRGFKREHTCEKGLARLIKRKGNYVVETTGDWGGPLFEGDVDWVTRVGYYYPFGSGPVSAAVLLDVLEQDF